jgi:O-antigen ligase
MLNALTHWGDRQSLFLIVERLPFLGFIFVYSRLALSRPAAIIESMELGALFGACSALAIASFQYFGGDHRPAAFSGNANLFAYTTGVAFMINLIAARRNGGAKEALFWVGVIAALFAMLLSGSKGMLAAILIGGATIFAMTQKPPAGRRLNNIGVAIGVITVVVAALVMNLNIVDRITAFQTELNLPLDAPDTQQVSERLSLWKCGIDVATKNTLLGAGHSGALDALGYCTPQGPRYTHFHNQFIDNFAKGGVLSLAAAVLMIVCPLYFIKRAKNENPNDVYVNIFSMSFFVILLINGSFNTSFGNDVQDAYIIYCMICLAALCRYRSRIGLP